MSFKFNPLTGKFDLVGGGSGNILQMILAAFNLILIDNEYDVLVDNEFNVISEGE